MSKESPALIVEFLGIPGVGKTTLLKKASEVLQEEGYRTYSVVEAARPFARRSLLSRIVSRFSPVRYREQLLWQVFYYSSMLYRLKFQDQHRELVRYVKSSQKSRPPEAAINRRI